MKRLTIFCYQINLKVIIALVVDKIVFCIREPIGSSESKQLLKTRTDRCEIVSNLLQMSILGIIWIFMVGSK